jgi:histidinol-phosphate aminotransferase
MHKHEVCQFMDEGKPPVRMVNRKPLAEAARKRDRHEKGQEMISTKSITEMPVDDLTEVVAERLKTTRSAVLSFDDFTQVMTELLGTFYKPGCQLVGAGHVTPEIEIAADRAEIELVEALAVSPFSYDVESVLESIRSLHDLIYVANPNRITGANYTVADLEKLARAIPEGTMIIDEHYFDYFGISVFPLLDILTNLVIVRSFMTAPDLNCSDAGFLLANPDTITIIRDSCQISPLTSSMRRTILAALVNDETFAVQLRELHEEALRLASTLTRLGVQCRITPADFLLLRVASPKDVGNFLARYKTAVENLDGYPQLKNYLRYTIQSVNGNERFIEAFKKMPADYYRMKTIDGRSVTIKRPAQTAQGTNHKIEPENRLKRKPVSPAPSRG